MGYRAPDNTLHVALSIDGTPQSGPRRITAQVQDAYGRNVAGRFVLTVWYSNMGITGGEAFGAPDHSAEYGIIYPDTLDPEVQIVPADYANAHFIVRTDATGKVSFDTDGDGAVEHYVMAALDGPAFAISYMLYQP